MDWKKFNKLQEADKEKLLKEFKNKIEIAFRDTERLRNSSSAKGKAVLEKYRLRVVG